MLVSSVDRTQSENESVASHLWQSGRIGTRFAAGPAAPKPDRGVGTHIEQLIKREQDAGRFGWRRRDGYGRSHREAQRYVLGRPTQARYL